MEFREVLKKDISKNKIALGTKVGDLLDIDIDKYNSIIITGETGSGKSILLDQIILQLVNKYTSDELRLVIIDTVGTELNYYDDTNYKLLSALNDLDKSQEILAKVSEEVTRRKNILMDNQVSSIEEFNIKYNHNIPKLVIAIDDNKSLLDIEDVDNMLVNIIKELDNLNILLILSTNNVFNRFFEEDNNLLFKLRITFDNTNEQEAINANLPFSNDLKTGRFIMYKDGNYEEYKNFEFDDNIIKEIID